MPVTDLWEAGGRQPASIPAHKMQYDQDQRNHQKQVDQTPGDAREQADPPEYDQKNAY
jgi:hypothetical protein